MSRVDVVVLNWNGLADTERCLRSLREVEIGEGVSLQVWVIDNASTDGSAEQIPQHFPEARFVRNEENLRYAGGNNVGIRAALEDGADFVLLLNNDTEVERDLIEGLLRAAKGNPQSGVFGPIICNERGTVWYGGGVVRLGWGATWHSGMGRPPEERTSPSRETGYVTGCCFFVRAEVFRRVGLLDEGYFLYAEDADFCIRARRAGHASRVVPAVRMTHYVSSSSGGAINPFKAYQRTRAGLRLFSRHATGMARLTWPVGFCTLLVVHSIRWVVLGAPAATLAAWRAVLDHLRGTDPGLAFPPRRPNDLESAA